MRGYILIAALVLAGLAWTQEKPVRLPQFISPQAPLQEALPKELRSAKGRVWLWAGAGVVERATALGWVQPPPRPPRGMVDVNMHYRPPVRWPRLPVPDLSPGLNHPLDHYPIALTHPDGAEIAVNITLAINAETQLRDALASCRETKAPLFTSLHGHGAAVAPPGAQFVAHFAHGIGQPSALLYTIDTIGIMLSFRAWPAAWREGPAARDGLRVLADLAERINVLLAAPRKMPPSDTAAKTLALYQRLPGAALLDVSSPQPILLLDSAAGALCLLAQPGNEMIADPRMHTGYRFVPLPGKVLPHRRAEARDDSDAVCGATVV